MQQGTPKLEPKPWHNCGTASGYQGHRSRGESACGPCRGANTIARKEWGAKNRDRSNQIQYEWNANNREKRNTYMRGVVRRRRARKLSVESEPYTDNMIIDIHGSVCHVCSEDIDLTAPRHPSGGEGWEKGLQLDHVIPLFGGGTDKIDNIKPIHVKCNMLKGIKN